MASLLGVNFGSNRHAYFQTKITIHELANVPMVAGQFKAKWKVEHTHNLASAIAATTNHLPTTQAPGTPTSETPNGYGGSGEGSSGGVLRSLHHKKSASTLNSTFDRDDNGSIDSGSSRPRYHKDRDDTSSTYSGSHKHSRKGGIRILSSLRDVLKPHSSPSSSSSQLNQTSNESYETKIRKNRISTDTRSVDGEGSVHEEMEVLNGHHHERDSSQQSNSSSTGHQSQHSHHTHHSTHNHIGYDPRGETESEKIKDNKVVWERELDVGVRFNIEKPRQVSGGSHSAALTSDQQASNNTSSRSTDTGLRRGPSQRDITQGGGILHHDNSNSNSRDLNTSGWGMLAQSELRISVRADVPTGTDGHHPDHHTQMRLGHVSINLAEFAPHPHHHHHHHHHSSHTPQHSSTFTNRDQQQQGQQHHHTLSRTETRRYLLMDGPTNATIKVTVEMRHVGGTREYLVPANKMGLLVGTVAPFIENSSPPESKGPASSAGSDPDENSSTTGASGDNQHSDHYHSHHSFRTSSVTRALNDWGPHSVARHSRIPKENLNTKLTHKDTARAIKEASGGGRLAFSFGAGAHHDRPPESVIDSIFDSTTSNGNSSTSLMLTPTPSRTKNSSQSQQKDTKSPSKNHTTTSKAREFTPTQHHLSVNGGQEAKSRGSSASSKASGVRWDLTNEKNKPNSLSIPERDIDESRQTESPLPMEGSDDNHYTFEDLSSTPRKNEWASKMLNDNTLHTAEALQPPKIPPDVARKEALKALPSIDYPPPWTTDFSNNTYMNPSPSSPSTPSSISNGTLQKKQSRRTLGLSKEAAMMAGYRGAGWGTLELSKHSSNHSIDSDSGSEQNHGHYHHPYPHHRSPTFAYLHDRTRSPSPSPLQQLAH